MRGAEGVYAIGDCADVKSAEDPNTPGMKVLELTDVASALFKQADTDGNGSVDKNEFVAILSKLSATYPQVRALLPEDGAAGADAGDSHLQSIMDRFDDDKSGALDFREFAKAMAEADARLSSHPATAQVANQQGEYLARTLNAAARERRALGEAAKASDDVAPFRYTHLGSFATLGSEQAAMELPGDFISTGFGTMVLWYGAVHEQLRVVAEQVSRRRRLDQKKASGEGTVRACETHQGVGVCTGDACARTYVSTVVTRFFAFVTFRTMAHVLPDVARRYCLVLRRLGSRARRDG